MDRFGDWMQTFSGKQFWPLSPQPEDVDIIDIAHSLALQCRYGGHSARFYSVAEHSVLLARWLAVEGHSRSTCLWGLMHDAAEAYVGDMVRPLKASIPEFKAIERRVMLAITQRFRMLPIQPVAIGHADNRILVDEKRQNMAPGLTWSTDALQPLGVTLQFWTPEQAKAEFLSEFSHNEPLDDVAGHG